MNLVWMILWWFSSIWSDDSMLVVSSSEAPWQRIRAGAGKVKGRAYMLTLGRAKYSNLVTSRFGGWNMFRNAWCTLTPWPWGLEDATSCEWVQLRNPKDAPLPQLLRAISESCVWAANWDSWQHVAMWELDGGSFDPRLHYRQGVLEYFRFVRLS